jgi:hypothetical protein
MLYLHEYNIYMRGCGQYNSPKWQKSEMGRGEEEGVLLVIQI